MDCPQLPPEIWAVIEEFKLEAERSEVRRYFRTSVKRYLIGRTKRLKSRLDFYAESRQLWPPGSGSVWGGHWVRHEGGKYRNTDKHDPRVYGSGDGFWQFDHYHWSDYNVKHCGWNRR